MDYYVSPAGDDTAPGDRERPLASFEPLSSPDSPLEPGDSVHVRGGTFRSRGIVLRNVRGRPDAPISIVADGDAIPVIDCSAGDAAGLELDRCTGIVVRGLTIRGAARDGIRIDGSDRGRVTVAGVDVRDYARSGTGDGIRVTGAPNLSVRGCALRGGHRNADDESRGIAIAETSGRVRVSGSEFYRNTGGGAAATNAGDPGQIAFRRCIAHRNGFDSTGRRADGIPGFRIDGGVTLKRCIAYNNAGPGFEAAGTGVANEVIHATAWANAGAGYRVGGDALENCLAVANGEGPEGGDEARPVERSGGWPRRVGTWIHGDGGRRGCEENDTVGSDAPWFHSTDDTGPGFLRPRENCPVVDSGSDLGRPHTGDAPDVGARRAASVENDDRRDGGSATRSGVLQGWRRSG